MGEDWAAVNEGVELAVLATRIDVWREAVEQLPVKRPPRERSVEPGRVDADEKGLEAVLDELLGQELGVAAPKGKDRLLIDPAEPLLAIGANVG